MACNRSLALMENLKRTRETGNATAKAIAKLMSSIYQSASAIRFKLDFNRSLEELGPTLEELLKTNAGVMLLLTFDSVSELEGELVSRFTSLSIVGAENDRWKVIDKLKQPAFALPNGPILTSPKGCKMGDPFCQKMRVYVWFTNYFVDYLNF